MDYKDKDRMVKFYQSAFGSELNQQGTTGCVRMFRTEAPLSDPFTAAMQARSSVWNYRIPHRQPNTTTDSVAIPVTSV
jgi:hypothetical protein